MHERPIPFSAPMVRAILAGTNRTQSLSSILRIRSSGRKVLLSVVLEDRLICHPEQLFCKLHVDVGNTTGLTKLLHRCFGDELRAISLVVAPRHPGQVPLKGLKAGDRPCNYCTLGHIPTTERLELSLIRGLKSCENDHPTTNRFEVRFCCGLHRLKNLMQVGSECFQIVADERDKHQCSGFRLIPPLFLELLSVMPRQSNSGGNSSHRSHRLYPSCADITPADGRMDRDGQQYQHNHRCTNHFPHRISLTGHKPTSVGKV